MDYKMKRAASAKIGKKFAAALSAAVLVAPSVASAVQPIVAVAESQVKTATLDSNWNTVTVNDGEVDYAWMKVKKNDTTYYILYNFGITTPITIDSISFDSVTADAVSYYLVDDSIATKLTNEAELSALDGLEAGDIKGVGAKGLNGYKAVSLTASATYQVTDNVSLTEAEVANLEFGDSLDFTVNTDIEISDTAVGWYLANGSDATPGTVKMTDSKGNTVNTCWLSDLAEITATPADGFSFRAWDLEVASPTTATLTKADIEGLMADEDDAAGRAGVIDGGALKAVVNSNEFAVTFDAGEGTLVNASDAEIDFADLKVGDPLPAVNNPTGKDFDSWQLEDGTNLTEKANGGKVTKPVMTALLDAAGNGTEAVKVHAVYSVREDSDEYAELTFAPYNGKADQAYNNSDTFKKGGKVSTAVIADTEGDKDVDLVPVTASAFKGYKFVGWYRVEGVEGDKLVKVTDKEVLDEATLKSESNHDSTDAKVISSTKFVAVFERDGVGNEYTLSFDLNGANKKDVSLDFRPFDDQTLTVGDKKAELPTFDKVKERYVKPGFIATAYGSWNTQADGKGKTVEYPEQVDDLGKSGDVVLYWQWTQDTNIATFAVDGEGSIAAVDATGKEVADIALTTEGVKKATATLTLPSQHTLNGWTVAIADNKGKPVKSTVQVVKSLTAAGKLTDEAFMGTELDGEVIDKNAKDVLAKIVNSGQPGQQEQKFTVVFTANVTPWTYKATFGSEVREYTVGEDGTPFPEGKWMYGGVEITSKAQLDKLVTEDGQVMTLTEQTGADKTSLNEAVAEAEKVDTSAYTDESAKAFKDALAAAQDVLKDEAATQAQVDKANVDLAVAKAALVEKPADGWHQAGTDSWQYAKDGEYVKGAWVADGGNWYYMDANGFMLDGWLQDKDGNWYFMSQSHDGTFGAMCTGWVLSDGLWYYMNPNAGGPKGAMMTGWQWVNGKCYYLYEQTGGPKGACAISTTINGWQVGPDGAWIQ